MTIQEISTNNAERDSRFRVTDSFPQLGGLIQDVCYNPNQYNFVIKQSEAYARDYIAWQTSRKVPAFAVQTSSEPTGMEKYLAGILPSSQIVDAMNVIGTRIESSIKMNSQNTSQKNKLLDAIEHSNVRLNPHEVMLLSDIFGSELSRLRVVVLRATSGEKLANEQYRSKVKQSVRLTDRIQYPQSLRDIGNSFTYSYPLPSPEVSINGTASRQYNLAAGIGKFGHPLVRSALGLFTRPELQRQLEKTA